MKKCKYLSKTNFCTSPDTVCNNSFNPELICRVCVFKEEIDVIPSTCAYLGRKIPEKFESCSSCPNNTTQLHICKHPSIKETTLPKCQTCKLFVNKPFSIAPSLSIPKVGIVIGAYNWPSIIELQIKVIKATCGNIPILISDDFSDGASHSPQPGCKFYQMQVLAERYPLVTFYPNPQRLGHSGGDLSAFWKGLQWANTLNLDILAKISHRLLVNLPHWIQHYGSILLKRNNAIASQPCIQNGHIFPIRSECCVLNVKEWNRPEIISKLTPLVINPNGRPDTDVENILWGIIQKHFHGIMEPLLLLRKDRHLKNPGVLWHNANSLLDYQELGEKFGVILENDFTNIPSQLVPGYKLG